MRLFSTPAKRKPPATVRPAAKPPAEVVSIITRRIEITVEREIDLLETRIDVAREKFDTTE